MGEESTPGRGTDAGSARPRRRRARRAVRRGNEREAVSGVSSDERGDGWGEAAEGAAGGEHGSNDERLLRDVPPHW
ncbi:hypothetical protein [Myceligenerans xiligouense]|uniref:hypothetical protein n=1 Tax=Myceligenerans xiligouense TaxID=253184 RepID=UPI000F4FD286|nr:hypothetical protein [Myceligenerans xiligouense]